MTGIPCAPVPPTTKIFEVLKADIVSIRMAYTRCGPLRVFECQILSL